MHLCLFEDTASRNLLPLTYFRPVYDLRCGMFSLRERSIRHLQPKSVTLLAREYLVDVLREENPGHEVNQISADACLFVNGRLIMTSGFAKQLRKANSDTVFKAGNDIAAIRLSGENLKKSRSTNYADAIDLSDVKGVATVDVDALLVRYPWDLVYANETELGNDVILATHKSKGVSRNANVHKSAVLVGRKSIHIGTRSSVGAGAVLDASGGPIYIGSNVKIFPTAVIEGPCFIGDGSMIKVGAKIYGNTSIGTMCKVGGEVEHSIFHSHSNKQHDGFLGHSYLAPWVNLGAGTTTSNLKNTYGTIKVRINNEPVDSGRMFIGLTAGDHVKIGINGTIDTGTVIGPSSNMYGTAIPPKYIPPFTWGTADDLSVYDFKRAITVAETVMSRRNVIATEAYQELFRNVFTTTSNERTNYRS